MMSKLFLGVLMVLQAHLSSGAQPDCNNVWHEIAPLPDDMAEVSAGVVHWGANRKGRRLCVAGQKSSETYCYNAAINTWSAAPERPDTGDHHCGVSHFGNLYLLGGFDAETAFQRFDGKNWKTLPSLPTALASANCAALRNEIHICGGITGSSGSPGSRTTTNACYRFNFDTMAWKAGSPMGLGMNHAGSCRLAGSEKMYVVGGRRGGNTIASNPSFASCQVYHMRTRQWGWCPQTPIPMGGIGACVSWEDTTLGRYVLVMGGELSSAQYKEYGASYGGGSGTLDSVFAHRPGEGWTRLKGLPESKHGIAPVIMGGYVYVVGGGTAAGASASASAHRAQLADLVRCPG